MIENSLKLVKFSIGVAGAVLPSGMRGFGILAFLFVAQFRYQVSLPSFATQLCSQVKTFKAKTLTMPMRRYLFKYPSSLRAKRSNPGTELKGKYCKTEISQTRLLRRYAPRNDEEGEFE